MSFSLYTGAANTGKTAEINRVIASHVARRQSAVLLVPAEPDVSRALQDLAALAPLGLAISTFDRYLDGMWDQHGDGRSIATPVQRMTIVEESVRVWSPQASALRAPSRGMKGLLATLVQRAAEGHVPVELAAFPGGVARDLASFVTVYDRLLSQAKLIERSEAHRALTDLVPGLPLPAAIAADGFTGFTAGQERYLIAAAHHTAVFASLTYDQDVPATAAAADAVARLSTAGTRTHMDRTWPPANELQRIEVGLGTIGSPDVAATGAVIVTEAWGSAAEAARIVREAQDALAVGIPADQIAVVFRNAAKHKNDISAAFAEAGLPVEFDVRIPFRSTGLGRALMLVLDVDRLERGPLMDLVRSPYVAAENDELDRFDAASRGATPPSPRAWFRRHSPVTSTFLARASSAGTREGSGESQRAWYALVSAMLRHAGRDRADEEVRSDAAAARTFMDAVGGLAAFGDALTDRRLLADVLGQTDVVLGTRQRPGHVQVMSAERVRGRRYRCVILGGLTAGEFPRSEHENALSDPAVAASFAKAGVDLSPRSGLAEERLLFYLAATRATERLVLSRQTHDADGRALRPSVLVEEVLDLYRHPVTREWFAGEPPVHTLGLDGLAEAEWAPHTNRRARRTLVSDPERRSAAPSEVLRRARGGMTALSEAARALMAERERFSASELESYLTCPYLWCVQRLVQPRELDESVDERVMGQLGHEIMRRFYEALPERTGERRVTPASLPDARQLHAEVASACLQSVRPESAAAAVACRTVVRRTLGVVESDASLLPGFEPLAHEWSFGLADDDPPVSVGTFSIAGRVDRIDTDGRRAVLADYKSGAIGAEHGVTTFAERGLVQLALYAEVVSRRLDLEVAGGLYRSFRGGKPRGFVREDLADTAFVRTDILGDADAVRLQLDESIERAETAVSRLRAGDIRPDPLGGSCPPYCPAAAFCEEWRPKRG